MSAVLGQAQASDEARPRLQTGERQVKIMRKLQIVLAFFAVFAFGAIAVGSASAELTLLAEWLFNGAAIPALLPVTITGEVLLSLLEFGIEVADILCSMIFVGSVGPNGEGEITKILNLAKEEIGVELVGLSLECMVDASAIAGCGAAGSIADFWIDQLPWLMNLELMESGSFLDRVSNSGYHLLCLANNEEELCTQSFTTVVSNEAGGVLDKFEPSENIPCTHGEGMFEGEGLIAHAEGTLSVSSE
jgi:hypothetical protein